MSGSDLAHQFLAIVEEIPFGKVATYGQIARLAGYPRHSRLVGQTMSRSEFYGDFPCHRVINSQGRLAPHWPAQKELLQAENIHFQTNGNVDLKKSQWQP